MDALNPIDYMIATSTIGFAIAMMRQGFLISLAGIVATIASVIGALILNDAVTVYIAAHYVLPQLAARVFAFTAAWIILQIVFSIAIHIIVTPLQRWFSSSVGFSTVDTVLAALLGVLRGLISGVLLVLPFVITPIAPTMTAAVQESYIGSRLTPVARAAFLTLQPFLGAALETSGLTELAPPQRPDESSELGFQVTDGLSVDQEDENRLLELVNKQRSDAGLVPLVIDPQMTELARVHSRDMFEHGYLGRVSSDHLTPADRMSRAGIAAQDSAENVTYAPLVQVAFEGMMQSPSLRANILSPGFTHIGIGVIASPYSGKMYTQDFR